MGYLAGREASRPDEQVQVKPQQQWPESPLSNPLAALGLCHLIVIATDRFPQRGCDPGWAQGENFLWPGPAWWTGSRQSLGRSLRLGGGEWGW